MDVRALKRKSIQYRKRTLTAIKQAKAGHTGGDLSCLDILNVLYNHVMEISPENALSSDRDRFIQSKGHSVEALYVVLADKGFFPDADLDTICQYKSDFIGHPTRKVPGIEQNTGALGHGLSVAVGMALAAKMDQKSYRVFTLLGDGELTEGSIWEASMSAAQYKLDNLVVIVDRNGLQITGSTENVMALEPLKQKFESFGYAVKSANGNDIDSLLEVFSQIPFVPGKPSLIIANTIKGKGVSFIEHQVSWHHHVPTDEEMTIALQELDADLEAQHG